VKTNGNARELRQATTVGSEDAKGEALVEDETELVLFLESDLRRSESSGERYDTCQLDLPSTSRSSFM
jgi:hypothetical protein